MRHHPRPPVTSVTVRVQLVADAELPTPQGYGTVSRRGDSEVRSCPSRTERHRYAPCTTRAWSTDGGASTGRGGARRMWQRGHGVHTGPPARVDPSLRIWLFVKPAVHARSPSAMTAARCVAAQAWVAGRSSRIRCRCSTRRCSLQHVVVLRFDAAESQGDHRSLSRAAMTPTANPTARRPTPEPPSLPLAPSLDAAASISGGDKGDRTLHARRTTHPKPASARYFSPRFPRWR